MQYYRLLLLLLLKTPFFPVAPAGRPAAGKAGRGRGERRPATAARPLPASAAAFRGGRFLRRTHGGTAGWGWAAPFPFLLSPHSPLSPRNAPSRPRGKAPGRGPAEGEGLGGRAGCLLRVPGPLLGPRGAPAAPFPSSRLSPGRAHRF